MAAVRVLACLLLVAFFLQVSGAPAEAGTGKTAEAANLEERLQQALELALAVEAQERHLEVGRAPWNFSARWGSPVPGSDWDTLEQRANQLLRDLRELLA